MTRTFRGDEVIEIPNEFGEVEVTSNFGEVELPNEFGEVVIQGAPAGTVLYRILITQAGEIIRDTSDNVLLARS